MKGAGTLQVTTPTEREIVLTRDFDAPHSLVFDAFTQPELLKRWLLGPPGWSMPVCEFNLKVGGTYRYVWRKDDGTEMGMGGVCREIVAPKRLVATERFDQSWYPGEALVTIVLSFSAVWSGEGFSCAMTGCAPCFPGEVRRDAAWTWHEARSFR